MEYVRLFRRRGFAAKEAARCMVLEFEVVVEADILDGCLFGCSRRRRGLWMEAFEDGDFVSWLGWSGV